MHPFLNPQQELAAEKLMSPKGRARELSRPVKREAGDQAVIEEIFENERLQVGAGGLGDSGVQWPSQCRLHDPPRPSPLLNSMRDTRSLSPLPVAIPWVGPLVAGPLSSYRPRGALVPPRGAGDGSRGRARIQAGGSPRAQGAGH